MAWVEPQFDAQRINVAGRALVQALNADIQGWSATEWSAFDQELAVINNWRSAHAYPLNTFQINLRTTSRKFDKSALVAQRIKRLTSIGAKLDRLTSMKLSQMQDLGGCRAIYSNIGIVQQVVKYYLHKSAMKHERVSFDDYIEKPKASGYRGVHLVYRYVSDKSKTAFNGLKIEMQLRSRYQHAWATAVETVGTFSGEALKSSLGSEDWQRFFALMASAIALRERAEVVPGTPSSRNELIRELSRYARQLRVRHRLTSYGKALKRISRVAAGSRNSGLFLLELDPKSGSLRISSFVRAERDIAEMRYAEAELRQRRNPGSDAVLVSVDSVNSLSRAYPNYFADTRLFLELLSQALLRHSRGIVVPDRQLELLLPVE